jgi:hypothetical protein
MQIVIPEARSDAAPFAKASNNFLVNMLGYMMIVFCLPRNGKMPRKANSKFEGLEAGFSVKLAQLAHYLASCSSSSRMCFDSWLSGQMNIERHQ